jgi:hypothetical protein
MLTVGALNLFSWMVAAVMTLFGFCASCKRTAERMTERAIRRRKARAARRALALAAAASAATASPAPALAATMSAAA